MKDLNFEVGDQLIISCRPVDAEVIRRLGDHYCIKWPWGEVDPQSGFQQDESKAFPVESDSFEWENTPWRVEPDFSELRVGDSCVVGIPPTRVIVQSVETFNPPRDIGWLPRPSVGLAVVNVGRFQNHPEAGYMIYLDGPDPLKVILS